MSHAKEKKKQINLQKMIYIFDIYFSICTVEALTLLSPTVVAG